MTSSAIKQEPTNNIVMQQSKNLGMHITPERKQFVMKEYFIS